MASQGRGSGACGADAPSDRTGWRIDMAISSETTFRKDKANKFYWAFKAKKLQPPMKGDGTRQPIGFMYRFQNKDSSSNDCGVLLAMQIDILNVAYDRIVARDYAGAQAALDGTDPMIRNEYPWFFGRSLFNDRTHD